MKLYIYEVRVSKNTFHNKTFDWLYYLNNSKNIPKPLKYEGMHLDFAVGLDTPIDQDKKDMLKSVGIDILGYPGEKIIDIDSKTYNNEHELLAHVEEINEYCVKVLNYVILETQKNKDYYEELIKNLPKKWTSI